MNRYHRIVSSPSLPSTDRRGGAVIVVVLALMTTLTFLGLFFYNFAKEEVMISRNVLEAATVAAPVQDGFTIDVPATINFGLRQVIVSTPADRRNSALSAVNTAGNPVSPWSLLASRLGTMNADGSPIDAHPFTGRGMVLIVDNNSDGQITAADVSATLGIDVDRNGTADYPQLQFDFNGDGTIDADQNTFVLNRSRAASLPAAFLPVPGNVLVNFDLDTGYTYADHNNPFLALDYWDLGQLSNPDDDVHVVKPSFFLPGLHPERRRFVGGQSGFFHYYTDINPVAVDTDPATSQQTFRPHRGHFNASNPLVARFIRPGPGLVPGPGAFSGGTIPALSGDTTRRLRPFPKLDMTNLVTGQPRDPITGLGVWDGSSSTLYDFDVDIDKDGTKDAIYIDLDHPIMRFPNGAEYVPIYAFKIIDQDSLLNVNTHGNLADFQQKSNRGIASLHNDIYAYGDAVTPNFFTRFAHQSNLGFSVSEVNPAIALFANPLPNAAAPAFPTPFFQSLAAVTQVLESYNWLVFDRWDENMNTPHTPPWQPAQFRHNDGILPDFWTQGQLANMELALLMYGRPVIDSATGAFVAGPTGSHLIWPGRYGNDAWTSLTAAITQDLTAAITQDGDIAGIVPRFFSAPGLAFLDEEPRAATTNAPLPNDAPDDYLPASPGPDGIDDNANDNQIGTVANAFQDRNDFRERWRPTPGSAGPSFFDVNRPQTAAPAFNPVSGLGHFDPRLRISLPSAMHPIDVTGLADSSKGQGLASSYIRPGGATTTGTRLLGNGGLTNNPMRWVQYPNHIEAGFQDQGSVGGVSSATPAATSSNSTYLNAFGGALQPPGRTFDLLLNDSGEVNLFAGIGVQADDPFAVKELAALQLSKSDWQDASFQSRLRNLLPVNFEHNLLAGYIRSQFTTTSWDRLEFAFSTAGGGLRNWEFNDADPPLTPAQFPPSGYTFPFRFPPRFGTLFGSRHENTNPAAPASYVERSLNAGTGRVDGSVVAIDPFRPEVRRLLTVVQADPTTPQSAWRTLFPQQPLDLNRLLSDDILPAGGAARTGLSAAVTDWRFTDRAFDDKGNPIFRNLTPHTTVPVGSTMSAMIHLNMTQLLMTTSLPPGHAYTNLANINADPAAQEWWARYDRQRLARDIYVLLYTLNGGIVDNTTAGTIDPNSNPDSFNAAVSASIDPDLARELAQFAVNYVDALDRDNVIARFDYDPDLSNGWGTAGSPLTAPGSTVFGVEAQSLCFSEVLLIETEAQSTDNNITLFREDQPTDTQHRFLYVELRNVSPFDMELNTETWRIVRMNLTTGTPQVEARFQQDTTGQGKTVPAGANYLIGCHDRTVVCPTGDVGSELIADLFGTTGNTALDLVAPKSSSAVTFSSATSRDPVSNTNNTAGFDGLDFDLTEWNDSNINNDRNKVQFNYLNGFTFPAPQTVPSLVEAFDSTMATGPGPGFILSLQRRKNLNGNGIDEEWIEVDRFTMQQQTNLLDTSSNAQATLKAEFDSRMHSQERINPWFSGELTAVAGVLQHPGPGTTAPGAPQVNHSLDANTTRKNQVNDLFRNRVQTPGNEPTFVNPNPPNDPVYPVFQPHFDRNLASRIDLLSVPIYGQLAFNNALNPNAILNPVDSSAGYQVAVGHLRFIGGVTQNMLTQKWYPNGHRTAQVRMLYPHPNDTNGILDIKSATSMTPHTWKDVKAETYQNRWYRLLNFVDVPPRTEDYAYAQLDWRRRTAGQVNINGIRHEHVLAGVIDDDVHLDPLTNDEAMSNTLAATGLPGQLTPSTDAVDTGRVWFDELRAGRDGVRPSSFFAVAGGGDVIELPGTPLSKPYRPLGSIGPTLTTMTPLQQQSSAGASVESTILRHHSPASPALSGSNFVNATALEARPFADFNNGGGGGTNDDDQIDYHTRNRILAKVANLTTERSNVFAIWVGFQLHEAHEPLPGTVQIGARAEQFPLYRQLVVVDMSRLEEAYDPQTRQYDFEKFIIYRQTLP